MAATLALMAIPTNPAPAAEYNAYDGNWHFSLAPYLWIPGYDASFNFRAGPGGGRPTAEAGPLDVLAKLQFVFMGMADVRKGRWSVFTDFLYLDLSDDRGRVLSVTGPNGTVEIPINTATKTGFTGTLWTLAPAYSIYHRGPTSADVFLGLRYFNMTANLDWSFSNALNTLSRSGSLSQSTSLWDVVAGAKGRVGLGRSHWFLNYYGDVGGGTSDLTWQAAGGFGYALSWGDIALDFRYLKYSPGGNTKLLRDLELYGPHLGFSFHF